ncbi:MAG: IS200/IS605 family transposase [Candidatus Schekmanbacteria bacterium]|nr:IS200/IS605 family transposase [Candidatus Schekmanbacteria bacterium]
MGLYQKSSHVVDQCKYHFVWVPKYRFRILDKKLREELKKIIEQLCNWEDFVIIEGSIQLDHVHLFLSVPPKYSPSQEMKVLKGKSAERMMKAHEELRKKYWGQHMWARGYFVNTVGIDEETIKKYIAE